MSYHDPDPHPVPPPETTEMPLPARVESEPPDVPDFEAMTLAQALNYFFWRPRHAARLFWQVLTDDPDRPRAQVPPPDDRPDHDDGGPGGAASEWSAHEIVIEAEDEPPFPATGGAAQALPARPLAAARAARLRIGVLGLAMLLAVQGGSILAGAARDPARRATGDPNGALVWLAVAGAIYAGFELWASRDWWARRFPRAAGWLRIHRAESGRPVLWDTGLGAAALVLLWLALLIGGVILPAILLAAAALAWIALALGGSAPPEAVEAEVPSVPHVAAARPRRTLAEWLNVHAVRLMLIPPALLLSVLAYTLNVARDSTGRIGDVVLTPEGVVSWGLSVVLWLAILGGAARGWRVRRAGLRPTWTGAVLAGIVVIGAIFRLYALDGTPPEMTSDHIEKLLDALRVHEGYYAVFFPNNGGREGFQMYVVALIAQLGVGFSFTALKLATVIEGLITLPVLWWMARQVFGDATARDRQLGNWTGLALAGLVAISSWHVMLSRLGLRIVLTPLTTALVVGFLARALRHNRMGDYLALGFTLGAGVYFYQANRMLPLVVAVGVGLALLAGVRSWRGLGSRLLDIVGFGALVAAPLLIVWYGGRLMQESGSGQVEITGERLVTYLPMVAMVWFSLLVLAVRGRAGDRVLQVGGGSLAAAAIALALYVPLYHYGQLFPEDFWNRTRGRMFGEDTFVRLDPETDQLVGYSPGIGEQVERFWDQRDVFRDNYLDALRMYHWEGDGAWITNADAHPALDPLTGGLAALGLVMWAVWVVRRPGVIGGLIPAGALIMLLPSAMTLAYTIENPSFTRASGTIPFVLLLAALPLGALGWWLSQAGWQVRGIGFGVAPGVIVLAGVLLIALPANWENFFSDYRLSYSYSWKPYREIARPLREFARGEGSYGNAFMVAFPHWLDHRILGTMAGDIHWPNGLVTRDELFPMIERNRGTRYELDESRPVFVMFHPGDGETAAFLQRTYPDGELALYEYQYDTSHGMQAGSFYIFRAPPDEFG